MGDGAEIDLDLGIARFRILPGQSPHLAARESDVTDGIQKHDGKQALKASVKRIAGLQETLWADRRWAVLVILQGLDTSGKDGTIKHVLSGVNPQGVQVTSFSAPNREELSHDFLWRVHQKLPPRGMIGIFNRSHYEEVIVPRIDHSVLEMAGLPRVLVGPDIWRQRLADIAAFERYVARQGTAVVKVFLHISAEEQRERLLARLDDPAKNWKFDPADVAVHGRFAEYLEAYEDAIQATSSPEAPWYVVPYDHKWYGRLVVAEVLAETLRGLKVQPPKMPEDRSEALDAARKTLADAG